MTKLIEDQKTADRIKEARAALRGVNTHVTDVLKHSESMATTMTNTAATLRQLAEKSGNVYIESYVSGQGYSPVSLKKTLQNMADELARGAAQ